MGADCRTWFGKYALCIFNFTFFVCGTLILGTGVWLAADKASLIALLRMVESQHINQFAQPLIIEQLAYVVIIIGSITFLLSFLGYCGAIRESKCLLKLYGILLILLLLAEIVTCGLSVFYKNTAHKETKSFLQTMISKYYTSKEHTDAVTLFWNQLMSNFQCCGVNGYEDFQTSTAWLEHRGNRTIPEACCKLIDVVNLIPLDEDCTLNPNETNSYYRKGCYDSFTQWIISHRELILGVLLAVGVIQLLLIFLAFCLCKSFTKYHTMRL